MPPTNLLTPQSPEWNAERGAFNVLLDQEPAGIAVPASAAELAEVVRGAVADGKRVAAQRTGHTAAPLGSLADTVLVRTAGLGGAEIDAAARRARVGGGALWNEVVPAASEHGLAALHGSSPTVGIAGYTLGGGVSFYARKHGLASNRVTAIELVDAKGEQLRVDADHEPDLFWALRGGGGSFGIVTALEFELLELPQVYAGALFFPLEQASQVFHGWREWTAGAPEEATTVARILNFPPLPDIPDPFRGKSFASLELIHCGELAAAEAIGATLRALGTPTMDTLAAQPPAGISGLHMDPTEPSPYASDSLLIGELPDAGIDALLAAVGPGSGSKLASLEVRHCGGALARAAADSGALATLPGQFLTYAVGIIASPELAAPTKGWLSGFRDALEPYNSGNYLNFCDDPVGVETAFPPETVARLREVKNSYDPDNVFHSNHPVTG